MPMMINATVAKPAGRSSNSWSTSATTAVPRPQHAANGRSQQKFFRDGNDPKPRPKRKRKPCKPGFTAKVCALLLLKVCALSSVIGLMLIEILFPILL